MLHHVLIYLLIMLNLACLNILLFFFHVIENIYSAFQEFAMDSEQVQLYSLFSIPMNIYYSVL